MTRIFLTNCLCILETKYNETLIEYITRKRDYTCAKENRIFAIHDWVLANKAKAQIIHVAYITGKDNIPEIINYWYYYEFEHDEQAVECALRFGDGNMHRWSNENFVRLV